MPHFQPASAEESPTSTSSSCFHHVRAFTEPFQWFSHQSECCRISNDALKLGLALVPSGGLPSPTCSDCDESDWQIDRFDGSCSDQRSTFSSLSGSAESSVSPCSRPTNERGAYLIPLTPSSISKEPERPSNSNASTQVSDLIPFPSHSSFLERLKSSLVTNDKKTPSPNPRSAAAHFQNDSEFSDRYVSNRDTSQSLSGNFHLSKSPDQLSNPERLHRDASSTPDPFVTLASARNREDRLLLTPSRRRVRNVVPRTISGASALGVTSNGVALPRRHVSAGAVWNVGGNIASTLPGPVDRISDGRGGMLGSGTNAPMYTSSFLKSDTSSQEHDFLEDRLAAALDVDRTTRMLNISRSPEREQRASSSPVGSKRKFPYVQQRTKWVDGEWIREDTPSLLDAPQLRDDYYCSVLAYCHTSRTLAVGLSNRVYLWSEAYGVEFPRMEESTDDNTYVSSLSFSSSEGGHSILAIGRNNGQISLWSLYDSEGTRFKTQQSNAIACVAFKPVTTRRPSERFGSLVAMDDLLVGDEVGIVNYYSIEWMNNQQVDIHGWQGSMKLLAKINVHSQQICGLAWSHDGEFFATGANDNGCCLFEVKDILTPQVPLGVRTVQRKSLESLMMTRFGMNRSKNTTLPFLPEISLSTCHQGVQGEQPLPSYYISNNSISPLRRHASGHQPILEITEGRQKHRWIHSAAIKAIAFCPWQRGLLATGGGSNDRAIHFYHTLSGACLATIDVQAQVTSLIWSTGRREIAATFGYAQPEHPYRIAVFSWPDCKQVVAIPWGNELRALLAIPYPGGPNQVSRKAGEGETWWSRTADEGCIVVACSDESVKFHEVWSGRRKSTMGNMGLLGGSDILEGLEGIDKEGPEVIR